MIFILDRQQKVINILKNNGGVSDAPPFFDDTLTEDLATGSETFQFTTIGMGNVSRDLIVGNYVAFKKNGKYKLFQIMQVEETHEEVIYITVYCEGAGLELINKVFRKRTINSASLRTFLTTVLVDTGWTVGAVEGSAVNTVDLELEDSSVYAILQNNIGKYNCELEFRVVIKNGRVSAKYVDAYGNRGKVTGKRFTFGQDIEGLTRRTDSTELYTALIGVGKNGLSFRNTTVSGIDKPAGQDFVADQKSYERYNHNGYHIMGIFEYETESPEELLRETYKQLQKVKSPKYEYEVSVALLGDLLGEKWNSVSIGDTVGIVDNAFNPPIHLMARVSKLETSFTNPQGDSCTLSNFVEVKSNITDEMRRIASQLEGYVDGAIGNKFPIGGEDIQEGAILSEHIYQNTITTDHLIADCVTADKIEANSITAEHIKADQIEADHIKARQIEAEHIKADSITAYEIKTGTITAESGIIADATIGTAQIKDLAVTVGKIQNAFVDSLVANQGKFQSAHIGILTSENIDAKTITADHIKATVIDAINMNVSGKISADRIEAIKMEVEEIDAGKITTGTLDADRIGANTIDATKLIITDMTNLAVYYQDKRDSAKVYNITKRDTMLSNPYIASDLDEGSEFIFETYCKTFDNTTTLDLLASVFVYYTDGTVSYHTSSLAKATEYRNMKKATSVVKIPSFGGKTPRTFVPYLTINKPTDNTTSEKWQIQQLSVRRKNNGKLIVDGSIKTNHLDSGSITTDKLDANAITADLITSSVVQAINMSAQKIDAKNINTDNLKVNGSLIAGDISADSIKSNVISAINSYAGTMKIKQGQIEKLQVGNANIVDLDASKIKTGKLSADRIDVDKILIKDANITGTITASKISGGTLDASKMTVKNLKADSITAGSITVEGNNLIHNTDFTKKGTGWSGNGQIDANTTYLRYNSLKIIGVGSEYSEFVSAYYGESFVITMNTLLKTSTGIPTTLPLVVFEEFAEKTSQRIAYQESVISNVPDNWKRYFATYKVSKQETKFVRIRLYSREAEKVVWFNQPMLSRGTIASVWKLHNDELISNGAIDTDKIKNEAINSDKLNVEELFVGDNAFIKKLKAVEIDASNITTGTISGERIDIKGLISFEALDQDLQKVFDVQGDKTYINGGMIATNTIKADKIDLLSGITVKGEDNTTTFSIASNGQVEVNGLLKSGNFDEAKKTGYQISPDGRAILNQATVRGNVILPNAGITNDYDMSQEAERNYWQNSKGSFSKKDFTGAVNVSIGLTKIMIPKTVKSGDFYTVSFDVTYTNLVPKSPLAEGEYVRTVLQGYGDVTNWNDGAFAGIHFSLEYNKPETITTKIILQGSFKETHFKNSFWQMGIRTDCIKSGEIIVNNLKFEIGKNNNPEWTPAPEDNLNPVRIWAGSSYELKDNAPFRVMQNGDVFATNGTFSGKMFGALDAGLVHIHNDEIVINSTSTYIDEYGYEQSILPLDYNPNPYLRLGQGQSLINTDLVLGSETDRKIEFLNSNREFTLNNMDMKVTGAMTDMLMDRASGAFGGLNLIGRVSDGHHVLRHSSSADRQGTMIFDSEGSQGQRGDFSFTRKNYYEDVKVDVDGSLVVKSSISSSKQNIEMRSVSNEGWGFYAT